MNNTDDIEISSGHVKREEETVVTFYVEGRRS